ncbi:MAG: cobalamin B12-binding domain-containing protein [Bacillota bacterium]
MTFEANLKKALELNDKARAFSLTKTFIKDIDTLRTFYEETIPNILNSIDCQEDDFECVFHEHRISAVVRALIEMSYDYVLEYKMTLSDPRHVVIACMQNETHELGAIIGAYLFELYGFNTTYIGADTPLKTLEGAINYAPVDYLVLSVTNDYNLVTLRKFIFQLRALNKSFKIIGAGRGIVRHQTKVQLDATITSSQDIETLIEKEDLLCSPSK